MTIILGQPESVNQWVTLLQLLTPFLAAAVVAMLGLLAYWMQKRADQLEKLHDEKREVYRTLINSLSDYDTDVAMRRNLGYKKVDADMTDKVLRNLAEMELYAPTELVDLANDMFEGLLANEPTTIGLRLVAKAMRQDLNG
jgi:Tfp pilus assembly protein PilO